MAAEDVRAFIADHLSVEHFAAYLADDAHYAVLVAEPVTGGAGGPALVGYTLLVLPLDPAEPPYADDVAVLVRQRPAAELSKCYVLPAYQGTGVAGALLEATIAAAESADVAGEPVAALWLGTNRANRRAQRSYARHGFTVAGTRRFRVGKALEEDVVMVRPLRGVAETTAPPAAAR
ncbi:GNAT family N-acetyltransferase [Georgenia sp. AZ-5]|uniref:GNAT family N-acetyltransferase n=1 Tax=Georgenia sp. AZ-5 TaxID=3367526 RepID=UPI00375420D6